MKLNTKKIKTEMKRQKLRQTDIALKLGLTRQRIHYIINSGTKSFRVTEMIAKVLKLEPKDLII